MNNKIHRVKGAFGADAGVSMRLYNDNNFNWQELDAIHLLMNHRSYCTMDQFS